MDKYERNVLINSKKRLRKDTGAFCPANPARWRLGSRLRLGAASQLLQFGRGHPSHFYQLWVCPKYNMYIAARFNATIQTSPPGFTKSSGSGMGVLAHFSGCCDQLLILNTT